MQAGVCDTPGRNTLMGWYTVTAGTIGRNLSAAACMDYTSPPMGKLIEPRPGASIEPLVK